MRFSIHSVINGTFSFHFHSIHASKTFFGTKQYNPELSVAHTPLLANIIFLAAFQIQRPQDGAIPFGQFFQSVVDGIAHFEDFGLGPDAPVPNRHVRIDRGFPPDSPTIFEYHVSANTVEESAELLGIANQLPLLGTKKPRQAFLDEIIHIGAAMADMVQNFVAQFQAQPIDVRFGYRGFVYGWFGIHGALECGTRKLGMTNLNNAGFSP
jgi:hypothetical protein